MPAHEELEFSVTAPGFGNRLVAQTTTGNRALRLNVTLTSEAALRARYSVFGSAGPEEGTGQLLATIQAPAGSSAGIEGATIDVEPRPVHGPVFLDPTGKPSPHENSVRVAVASGFETRVIMTCHW